MAAFRYTAVSIKASRYSGVCSIDPPPTRSRAWAARARLFEFGPLMTAVHG